MVQSSHNTHHSQQIKRHKRDVKTSDPKKLEQLHLDLIRKSGFLYVVDPGGYVGNSAVMEIGYALASKKPIYALEEPGEFILKLFVEILSPEGAMKRHNGLK